MNTVMQGEKEKEKEEFQDRDQQENHKYLHQTSQFDVRDHECEHRRDKGADTDMGNGMLTMKSSRGNMRRSK